MTVILSIKPEYAFRIFSGEKKVEYRRKPIKNANKVIVYVTKPIGRILGEFKIDDLICAPPSELWEKTHQIGGIKREAFFDYFRGRDQAFALAIKNVKKYEEERELRDYGIKVAPQFFCYI